MASISDIKIDLTPELSSVFQEFIEQIGCLKKMITGLSSEIDDLKNELRLLKAFKPQMINVTSLSTPKGHLDLRLPDGQVIRTETDEGLELTAGQVDISKCHVIGPLTESFNDGSTRPSEDTD